MNDLFNNREIASGIWLAITVFFVARNISVRESFHTLLKSFCNWKVIVPIAIMILYVSLCVSMLHSYSLWTTSQLKDTIYWFLCSGFVLFMNIMTEHDYVAYYHKAIKRTIAVIIILELLVNFYTFPLIVELILIPFATVVAICAVYSEGKPEYAPAKKLFDAVLSIIGIGVIIYAARSVYLHYHDLLDLNVLRGILLPFELTLLFLPFLYFSKLISEYELMFVRLSFFIPKDDKLISYVKRLIFQQCHINLNRVSCFFADHRIELSNISNKHDADQIFNSFSTAHPHPKRLNTKRISK